jgi:hypothetical protein
MVAKQRTIVGMKPDGKKQTNEMRGFLTELE